MRKPEVTNGKIIGFTTRAATYVSANIYGVEIEHADGSGREIFEILDYNHKKWIGTPFNNPVGQIHSTAKIGDYVVLIHGQANGNDLGRKLFIGYATAL